MSRTRKSLVTHYFRAEDFDLARRQDIDPDEFSRQLAAMGPAWRGAFLRPRVKRTDDGSAYLDKWASQALPGE
jgi:hypothetical protein